MELQEVGRAGGARPPLVRAGAPAVRGALHDVGRPVALAARGVVHHFRTRPRQGLLPRVPGTPAGPRRPRRRLPRAPPRTLPELVRFDRRHVKRTLRGQSALVGPARQGPGQLVRPERESADPPRPDHVLGFAARVALGLLELARRGRARVLLDRVRARGNSGRTPERPPGRGDGGPALAGALRLPQAP